MRITTPFEKLLNSTINVAVVFVVFLPFLFFLTVPPLIKKIIFILLFLLYKLAVIIWNENQSVGMIITRTYWKEKYPLKNQLIHALLYTSSFSTLLFWVYFPFDLFLANMLLLQLPTVVLTKTTLHGYLAGKMITIKRS